MRAGTDTDAELSMIALHVSVWAEMVACRRQSQTVVTGVAAGSRPGSARSLFRADFAIEAKLPPVITVCPSRLRIPAQR